MAPTPAHVASDARGLSAIFFLSPRFLRLTSDSICDWCRGMTLSPDSLPIDLAAAHAMIRETRAALLAAEARASALESEAKHRALLIEQMKFTIAKLRHEQYGQSSERGAVLEQLELRLAELEEDASEAAAQAQLAAAAASAAKIKVEGFERKRPARRPLRPSTSVSACSAAW